jgi:hypothetical protein
LNNKPYTGGAQRLKIEFSEADIKAPRYERYHHPHPRVQRKIEAVYHSKVLCTKRFQEMSKNVPS